jgi:phospholipase/lecithinase/hemolysin
VAVLGVVIASSWLLYSDTVKATTVSKQISAIQTLPAAGSREAVLSLTLSDGSRTQYLVKAAPRSAISVLTDEHVKEAIQNTQLTSLGTAVNDGAATVPLGIALRITN